MLPALLITLREGLEAALIVTILAAYLVQTNRRREMGRVWIGVVAALVGSLAVGLAVAAGGAELSRKSQELLEGFAGIAAVGLLTWMIFWMRRHARFLKKELAEKTDQALASGNTFALPMLAFVAVGREGLETVLFLYAAFSASSDPAASGGGAVVGLLAAAALGYGIYKGSARLNLRMFFQITGGLIIVVAAGMVASSVHEFNEAGVLLFWTQTAWDATGFIGSSGIIGALLKGLIGYDPKPTVLQAVLYFAYLVPTLIAFYGLYPQIASAPSMTKKEVHAR
ncbi:MAG TPA: iron uptake transporter permease EfeU [Actinomycetota bacterium]|jgi:high-affinity iron transporter|nr:iron uptake transporter permease EfeU [Actinomycetota bacterium]